MEILLTSILYVVVKMFTLFKNCLTCSIVIFLCCRPIDVTFDNGKHSIGLGILQTKYNLKKIIDNLL